MDDAGLDHRFGLVRLDGIRKAREPVAADEQDVADSALGELGAHVRPKRGALIGLDPDSQDVLDPVHVDPDRQMGRPVGHMPARADLHADRVQIDDRRELVEGPAATP